VGRARLDRRWRKYRLLGMTPAPHVDCFLQAD
jgi:hypothetical protein